LRGSQQVPILHGLSPGLIDLNHDSNQAIKIMI